MNKNIIKLFILHDQIIMPCVLLHSHYTVIVVGHTKRMAETRIWTRVLAL